MTLLYNYLIGLQYIAYHQEKDVRKKMQPISRVFRRSEKHFRFYDLENSDAAHHLLWDSKSGGRNWDDFFPWKAKQYMLCSRVKYIVGFHALSLQKVDFSVENWIILFMDSILNPFFPLINLKAKICNLINYYSQMKLFM